MIHTSRFDSTFDITGELFAKNQVLDTNRAGRAQEGDDQPQDVPGYSDDRWRQLQHAFIMPEAARGCTRLMLTPTRCELLRTTGAQDQGAASRETNRAPMHGEIERPVVRNNYVLTMRRLHDADYAPTGTAAREYS